MQISLTKYFLSAIFLVATPFSALFAQAQSDDPAAALQTAGLTNHKWALGDASVGGEYDTLLGVIVNAQYAHSLGKDWAVGLISEYGPNQYRFNGTLGRKLWENAEIKLSTDYLSQVLPFDFDSGNIDQRVHQTAYGFEVQQNLHHAIFQSINVGGYRSATPNISLSDITYTSNDVSYTNQRNIAGAVAQGVDLGTDLKLTSTTALNAKVLYDDVQYNTEFTDSSDDASRLGGALELQQVVSDRLKVSVSSEVRAIYNTYGSKILWAPEFGQFLGLRLALSGERLISHNQTPNSNTYGLEFSLLNDDEAKSPHYVLSASSELPNLTDWVKDPAVYMQRVLATAEQKTTANTPTPTPIVLPIPTLISAIVPGGGGASVTYTTSGSIAWLGSTASKYNLYNIYFSSPAVAVAELSSGAYTLPSTASSNVVGTHDNLGTPATIGSTTMTSSGVGNATYGYAASFICESGTAIYSTTHCTNYVQATS